MPTVYGDPLRLPWVVDGLVEADPRLSGAETRPPPSDTREPIAVSA